MLLENTPSQAGNVNLKESFNFAGNLNLLFTHSTYMKPTLALTERRKKKHTETKNKSFV
jgi:hypothetical protein